MHEMPPPAPARPMPRWDAPGPRRAPRTLLPRTPTRGIPRRSVDALLEEATARRLTSVCAGPGWGKTIAVSGWLERRTALREAPVAWLTAQRQSNNLASFWDDVIATLRSTGALPADHPLQSLSVSAGVSEEVLASLLDGLESLPGPVLLVVDDFHEITDPGVLDSVTRTTQRAGMLHLLLLGRITPALPLHRLRVSGELAEVNAEDLAFTAAEIGALAHASDLDLTPAQVEQVLTRTEGWPAGVQLALLRASRSGPDAVATFAGTDRSVAEYLVAEVLDRNDPDTRDFLLRTSVTGQMCADLAAQIVAEAPAQALLERLEERNEFVTAMGSDRVWFRYHPLLRDLLDHALRRDDPAAHRQALQAAARWWAEHGDPILAMSHAASAQDWELFGSIYLAGAGPSLVGVERGALGELLGAVPYATLQEDASLHLAQAGAALVGGHLGAMSVHTDRARTLQASDTPTRPGQRVLTELLTCAAGRFLGDPQQVAQAGAAALDLLDVAEPMPATRGYRLIATQNLGVGQLWSGDLAGAERSLSEVLGAATEPDVDLARLGARAHLALTRALQGDLEGAADLATQALDWAAVRGWNTVLQARPAHTALALVRLVRGEADAAAAAIAAGLAAVVGGVELLPTAALHAMHAEAALSQGRLRAAGQSMRQASASAQVGRAEGVIVEVLAHAATEVFLVGLADGAGSTLKAELPPETPLLASCVARRQLAAGDPQVACRTAEAVVAAEEQETLFDRIALVEAWLVIAVAKDQSWAADQATHAMARAVAIARPQGLVRPFQVTRSARVSILLAAVQRDAGEEDPFVTHLLYSLRDAGPRASEPEPLSEPLTERELAMLRALPTMRSNTEIAADTYLSVNTVKAHLKGLFRKLGVSSRREAVERGRDLGLLD